MISGAADAACVTVAVAVTVTVCAPTDRAEVGATVGVAKAWSSGLVCATARAAKDNTVAKRAIGAILISGVVRSARVAGRMMSKRNLIISTQELCRQFSRTTYRLTSTVLEYQNIQACRIFHPPIQYMGSWRGWMFEYRDGEGQGCQVQRSPPSYRIKRPMNSTKTWISNTWRCNIMELWCKAVKL